jgi:hypothetical protein
MRVHQEVNKIWPFPVKVLEFIDEDEGYCAYETSTTMQFNVTRIIRELNQYHYHKEIFNLALLGLYAHELVGHHRVTPLVEFAPFMYNYPEQEQIPCHFQFAILNVRECIHALRKVPLYNLLLDLLFSIRKKINGKG